MQNKAKPLISKHSKFMHRLTSSLLVIFTCTIPLSCNQSSSKKKLSDEGTAKTSILRIGIADDPSTLDPRKARDTNSLTILKMLFEGLMRIGKNDFPELALAENVEISEDLKKYTFHLREAFWTNGDPVLASDFIYSWQKTLHPKFLADHCFQLYFLKNAKAIKEGKLPSQELGAKALDARTLEVELDNPTPYFLELLAFPVFFPVNEKIDHQTPHWADGVETYVSNGPFMLKDWRHSNQLFVEKNPTYWDAKNVKLARIEMVMLQETTAYNMYEKKALDWVGSPLSTLPLDALSDLKKKGLLYMKPILGTYFIRTNVERVPFDDVLLRKAFALAINRQALVDFVTQGNQVAALALVPPVLDLQHDPYFSDAALDEAKTLFEQALRERGLTRENFPKITLTYSSGERNHLIAQALQQQWFEAFGINIHLEAVEKKVYFDRISKQDFQLASSYWLADFNDPINFLEVFKYKDASTNNTHWEDPNFIRLLDESKKVSDSELRKKVLMQCEKILMDQMPIIPIFHYTMLYLKNEALKDEMFTSLGNLDFKWAYIEDSKEK